MRLVSHTQWIRRFFLPSVVLTIGVVLWGSTVGVLLYRKLGVSIGSATFVDEVLIHGLSGTIPVVFLNCLLLLFLFLARVAFRWWLVALFMLLIGTPVALFSGWHIANYLWNRNLGGTAWEAFLPQVIGLALAWILHALITAWLSQYRVVIIRRDDRRRSPCPRCGYELYGSNGTCPECGWQIPIGIAEDGPENAERA